MATYEQEINQHRSKPSYHKLKTMVKRQEDQKIRTRNFQARNERIETGVLVKTRERKHVSAERISGECCQWKAKGQCSKGYACRFSHDDSKRATVTQSCSPAPRPQTQNDGRSSSKRKSSRGTSPSGRKTQKACRHYFQGNCTNPSCDC